MKLKSKLFFYLLILIGILSFGFYPLAYLSSQSAFVSEDTIPKGLVVLQDNTILSNSSPTQNISTSSKPWAVIVTGYSSSVWETDDTPYTMADGKKVHWGAIANNKLPFGTKVKIPKLFGNTVFTVEDRMNLFKRDNHIDIWFPSTEKAREFGVKKTYLEIIK